MFSSMFTKLGIALVSAGIFVGGLFGLASKHDVTKVQTGVQHQLNEQAAHIANLEIKNIQTKNTQERNDPMVGANIPVVVSLFETSLQSSLSSTAASMTLVSGTDRQGTSLSGFMCFTIDEGTSIAEFVCGTASSTSVSSLTRGISPLTGTSTVSSLKFAHRRGASVKITNYPQLAIVSRILNGNETLPNTIRYDSTLSTSTIASNTLNLASVGLVNSIALQGAPYATTTVPGLVQFATGSQLSAGSIQASAGIYLVPSNGFFSSITRSATTVPVTLASGKLSQGFLNLAEAWTWTATTTMATTTIGGTLTVNASSTFLRLPVLSGSATPTSATMLTPKSYVDSKFSTLATSTEGVSFAVTANGVASTTGMTLVTDGLQNIVVTYDTVCTVAENQVHTETLAVVIDGSVKTSYAVANPVSEFAPFPCSINYVSLPLAAGSHVVKLRITDVSSGTTPVDVVGVGSAFTIR